MNILDGIQTFLQFINDNWTSILVIIGLVIGLVIKVKDYLTKSTEEKIEIAKKQIQQMILKLISDAEEDYEEWNKAGSIKRAQVIEKLFEEFPILSKVVDQEALIAWIDELIDESLKTLRDIVEENKENTI